MIQAIQGLKSFFETQESLNYFTGFFDFEENWELVKKGRTPFLNIDAYRETVSEVPGMSFDDSARMVIPVDFNFCQKAKDKRTAFMGSGGKPGLWGMKDDILAVLRDDQTAGDCISGIGLPVSIETGYEVMEQGLYVAIARMTVNVNIDRFR